MHVQVLREVEVVAHVRLLPAPEYDIPRVGPVVRAVVVCVRSGQVGKIQQQRMTRSVCGGSQVNHNGSTPLSTLKSGSCPSRTAGVDTNSDLVTNSA